MAVKELPLEKQEEQFKLQREALQVSYDWWLKEMQAAGEKMEAFNKDKIELSEEELQELRNKIKYLALKSDWEIKEKEKLNKIGQDLLCKKIAASLTGKSSNGG